jgi:hypothetical protein
MGTLNIKCSTRRGEEEEKFDEEGMEENKKAESNRLNHVKCTV